MVSASPLKGGYDPVPLSEQQTGFLNRPRFPGEGQEGLLSDAASIAGRHERSISHDRSGSHDQSVSPPSNRAPKLPDVDFGAPGVGGYRGHAY